MAIVTGRIALAELKDMALRTYGNMVKAVVDVERRVMALDAELHSDEETLLLDDGSRQENLWGINIYPDAPPDERVEFDSLINIRPWQGNRSRSVDDPQVRKVILETVTGLIEE